MDNFSASGSYAIYFDAAAVAQDTKNTVRNVNFNADYVGVLFVQGSINVVEYCNFDGGIVGIYDIAADGGDRFEFDNCQRQTIGIVSTSSPASGNLIENCLFANESALGFFAGNVGDKFRFDTAVGSTTLNIGGTLLGF
jgi:hypothetical protein